jgi:sugar phosphate isomerase/epimerase
MNIISQTVPVQYDTVFSPYAAAEWTAAFFDVARKGFTGVEIAVAYPGEIDAARVAAEAEKYALAVTTISTGQVYALEGAFFTANDAEKRERAREIIRGHIDLSAKLGFPPVTIGLIRGKLETREKTALLAQLRESLPPLCAYAAEKGVTLQLEPINKGETAFLNSMEECLAFMETLGNPASLGILYDTHHSYLEDASMPAAIRAAKGKITNVHLSDSHRGLPGEGAIDFRAVIKTLTEIGYSGAIALETMCVPSREHVLANYANAMGSLLNNGGRNV